MRIILIFFLLLLVFGCKHHEEVKQPPIKPLGPVFAGVVGENMVYTDFVPDINIDTLPLSPYHDFNDHSELLDINRDGVSDINIYVSRSDFNNRYSIMMNPINTTLNKISFSCSSIVCTHGPSSCNCYSCFGKLFFKQTGERISIDSLDWSNTKLSDENGTTFSNYFEFKSYIKSDSSNWQPIPNQYIGFRFIDNIDTLYGWIRVSIVGKAHIVVHDCAYQKR